MSERRGGEEGDAMILSCPFADLVREEVPEKKRMFSMSLAIPCSGQRPCVNSHGSSGESRRLPKKCCGKLSVGNSSSISSSIGKLQSIASLRIFTALGRIWLSKWMEGF